MEASVDWKFLPPILIHPSSKHWWLNHTLWCIYIISPNCAPPAEYSQVWSASTTSLHRVIKQHLTALFELHCSALNFTTVHCNALIFFALHCTALHCTTLHWTSVHCTALHCTSHLWTELYCTALHYTAVYCLKQVFCAPLTPAMFTVYKGRSCGPITPHYPARGKVMAVSAGHKCPVPSGWRQPASQPASHTGSLQPATLPTASQPAYSQPAYTPLP